LSNCRPLITLPSSDPVQVPHGELINLAKSSQGHLCTLTKITVDRTNFSPVGRSYDGNDWESVAGAYDSLNYECIQDQNICSVTIPLLDEKETTDAFFLTTFDKQALPVRDEIARFFEQTTFGTTSTLLNDLEGEYSTYSNHQRTTRLQYIFGNWVHDQMYNVNPSLHREFFRQRTLSKQEGSYPEGKSTHPCSKMSRWRYNPFDNRDRGRILSIAPASEEGIDDGKRYSLSIDGHVRTFVNNFRIQNKEIYRRFQSIMSKYSRKRQPALFKICYTGSLVGNLFTLSLDDEPCTKVIGGHPEINFNTNDYPLPNILNLPMPQSEESDDVIATFIKEDQLIMMIVKKPLGDSLCNEIPQVYDGNSIPRTFGRIVEGDVESFLIYDSRRILMRNDIETPLEDGGGRLTRTSNGSVSCSNVARTFLNEDTCKLSDINKSCINRDVIHADVKLDMKNLSRIANDSQRSLHYISGLRIEDESAIPVKPCTHGVRSRWNILWTEKICPTNLHQQTHDLFARLIEESDDPNIVVKDIYLTEGTNCHWLDQDVLDMMVKVGNKCYSTTHPDNFNVYDFTSWQTDHPGGSKPIKFFLNQGQSYLSYPDHHPMLRWQNAKSQFELIGKLGDYVRSKDFPSDFTPNLVNVVLGDIKSGKNTIVCGSPGEVENNLDEPILNSFQALPSSGKSILDNSEYMMQKKIVWTEIVLHAQDQLRQRMAWALAQILVISPGSDSLYLHTEVYTAYYDIFVRNAFGNYRDVLKEVAFSPMMADNLSYLKSRSTDYIFMTQKFIQYADENFAREIMQLFSIGLVQLNLDGTTKFDRNGKARLVYDNEDIMSYARAWTGFNMQLYRGNFEHKNLNTNYLDPMKIDIQWRDHIPKMGLEKQYVGDKYMLCNDLPNLSFLRRGAKYRLLGNSQLPELQDFGLRGDSDHNVLVLEESSDLFNNLCNRMNAEDDCSFLNNVELTKNLSCDNDECNVGSVQVVQINAESRTIFYEYIRPACINFPFFNEGKIISDRSRKRRSIICVDKGTTVAAEACCYNGSRQAFYNTCKYDGNLVPFSLAQERCEEIGASICNFSTVQDSFCGNCCNYDGLFWTNMDCDLGILIDPEGRVSIEKGPVFPNDPPYDFFRVQWEANLFPNDSNSCGNGFCEAVGNNCRCRIRVDNSAVFSSVPSRTQVLSQLHIGAVPPYMHNDDEYDLWDEKKNIKIYHKHGSSFNIDTVFEILDKHGRLLYLKNMASVVRVDGHDMYNFRNTPTFFAAVPHLRDAQFETEAVLDHYLYHDNTAPFLATRFIQRFGVSNPSPRFVKTVSIAFQEGTFTFENEIKSITFGTGIYGDLSSTIAAILLDRESRNIVLDSDPTYGSLREPLIKVIALMKNLDFKPKKNNDFVKLYGLESSIGQMVHEIPSVFSFFLPEYAPPGPIIHASLVSPEAMKLQHSISLLNGMLSLVKFGLTSCYEGFGPKSYNCNVKEGQFSGSSGSLTFNPSNKEDPETIIAEFATLLTSGRVSNERRNIIKKVFDEEQDPEKALSLVKQLLLTTPEFHATGGANSFKGETRRLLETSVETCSNYKAVVHVVLKGGCDSYNVLVPHSNCAEENLYNQYAEMRGTAALSKDELLLIDASSSAQPCSSFGLHPRLKTMQKLYDERNALFFANIGVLDEPVQKKNFREKTVTQLFAHNTMQEQISRLDPFRKAHGTEILGRLSDALSLNNYSVNGFALDAPISVLEGKDHKIKKIAVDTLSGLQRFNPAPSSDDFSAKIGQLNGKSGLHNNVYSDTWSSSMQNSIGLNEEFYWAHEMSDLKSSFPQTKEGRKFEFVSKMIASNDCRGSERDIFFVGIDGYDHHANMMNNLDSKLNNLDESLNSFVAELKVMDKFDDVTIVVSSDFGRTLSPNSGDGTDHAWSGHSFIIGGSVDGKRILGEYPSDLTDQSSLNIGRGRLIPTLSWDAVWNAVSQWLGIREQSNLNSVLPNRISFSEEDLFEESDIFVNIPSSNEGSSCEKSNVQTTCIPVNTTPRPSPSPTALPTKMTRILTDGPTVSPYHEQSTSPSDEPSISQGISPSTPITISQTHKPSMLYVSGPTIQPNTDGEKLTNGTSPFDSKGVRDSTASNNSNTSVITWLLPSLFSTVIIVTALLILKFRKKRYHTKWSSFSDENHVCQVEYDYTEHFSKKARNKSGGKVGNLFHFEKKEVEYVGMEVIPTFPNNISKY